MKKLLEGGTFFEGPRWHAGSWWVSDLYSHRVLRISQDGIAETIATVEHQLACIAPDFVDTRRKAACEAVLYTYQVDVPRGDSRP